MGIHVAPVHKNTGWTLVPTQLGHTVSPAELWGMQAGTGAVLSSKLSVMNYELNDWLEENKLPYFPTGETWTQVREPPKVVYVVPPPPRVSHMHQGNGPGARQAQLTLQWQNAGPSLRGQLPPSQQSNWHSQFNRNRTDRLQAAPHRNV